jgi:hypothetical protein
MRCSPSSRTERFATTTPATCCATHRAAARSPLYGCSRFAPHCCCSFTPLYLPSCLPRGWNVTIGTPANDGVVDSASDAAVCMHVYRTHACAWSCTHMHVCSCENALEPQSNRCFFGVVCVPVKGLSLLCRVQKSCRGMLCPTRKRNTRSNTTSRLPIVQQSRTI